MSKITNEARRIVSGLRDDSLDYPSDDDIVNALRTLADIVDRLPVTADGVPVYIGMAAYLPSHTKWCGYVEYILSDTAVATNDACHWPSAGCRAIGPYTERNLCDLYHTREAAEAAARPASVTNEDTDTQPNKLATGGEA